MMAVDGISAMGSRNATAIDGFDCCIKTQVHSASCLKVSLCIFSRAPQLQRGYGATLLWSRRASHRSITFQHVARCNV